MSIHYTIRPYQPGDEGGIVALYNEIFPEKMSLEGWRWKYTAGPCGRAMICVAEVDGRIVGHQAILLTQMKFGADLHPVGQVVDSMVLPAYREGDERGRTITLLVEAMKEQARAGGVALLWGTPTERMERRAREQGYVYLFSLPPLVRVLNPGYVFRKLTARPGLQAVGQALGRPLAGLFVVRHGAKRSAVPVGSAGDLEVRPVEVFDAQFDELWTAASADFHIGTVRSAAYLTWRYASCPHLHYLTFGAFRGGRLVGFLVLRHAEEGPWRAGYIVDLLTLPGDDTILHGLITHGLTHAREAGLDLLRAWVTEHSPAGHIFRGRGFALRPVTYRFLAMPPPLGPPTPQSWGEGLPPPQSWGEGPPPPQSWGEGPSTPQSWGELDPRWRDAEQWYLTLGDADVV